MLLPEWPPGSRAPAGGWAAAEAPGRAGGCSPGGSYIEPSCQSDAACTLRPAVCPTARSAPS